MRVAGILQVPTMRLRDILLQAKGDHLQAGEAGPVEQQLSGGQESQN